MSRIQRFIKDPFPGLSHWVGFALSIAALLVLLSVAAGRFWHVVGFAIYGGSLIALYAASALAHSVHCSPRAAERLDRLDYIAIFLLIAGTYTPLCLITLHGMWGWMVLAAEWLMAAVGIATIVMGGAKSDLLRTVLYLCMGWLALLIARPVARALPGEAIAWLCVGGAIYSIGAIIFVTNRPRLCPGRFVAHDLWHLMVLAGSACHFIVMVRFVA